MFKKTVSILMCVLFPMHVLAGNISSFLKPNFDQQENYVRKMQDMMSFLQDKNYAEKSVEILKTKFKSKQDVLYMQKIMASRDKPKQISLKVVDNTIEIKVDHLSKIVLSDFNPTDQSFKINGNIFKPSPEQTLEEINKTLIKMLMPSIKAQLIDLFVPKAHAWQLIAALLAAVGIIVILPAWIMSSKLDSITESLDEVIQACENRDEDVPFEESDTNMLIEKINVKKQSSGSSDFDVDKYENCTSWARKISNKYSTNSANLPAEIATEWCFKIKRANRCIEDYKENRPKKKSNDSPKNNSNKNDEGAS